MARTVRDSILDTRAARSRLKSSGKPYYRAIDTGLHLGYRKGKTGGRWVVRWYKGKQDYRVESLDGIADDVMDADGNRVLNFSQAQAAARKLFVERTREQDGLPAPDDGPFTVKKAIEAYLAYLDEHKKTGGDARYKANALILPSLGDIECSKLTTKRIAEWLTETAKQPARLRSTPGKKQRFRKHAGDDESKRKRRATANRVWTILRAALNAAWRADKIASDDAWRRVKPYEDVDKARVRYLTIAEAKRLINACPKDFRSLVQAALATGARFGGLSALNVEDFNPDSGTLHIDKSKGVDRHVVLTSEGAQLFASLCAGRKRGQPILLREDGQRWGASHQDRRMRKASEGAKIEPHANFHVLRHTYASHALMNGAPLMVVAENLGHKDTRMVQAHYGHLSKSYVADAIRAAAPTFDITIDDSVTALRA